MHRSRAAWGLGARLRDVVSASTRVKRSSPSPVCARQPHIRFEGKPGEQWTMFFKDPSGNALEFKAMTNPKNLFAKYVVHE